MLLSQSSDDVAYLMTRAQPYIAWALNDRDPARYKKDSNGTLLLLEEKKAIADQWSAPGASRRTPVVMEHADMRYVTDVTPPSAIVGYISGGLVGPDRSLYAILEVDRTHPVVRNVLDDLYSQRRKWGVSLMTRVFADGTKEIEHIGLTTDPAFGPEGSWAYEFALQAPPFRQAIRNRYLPVAIHVPESLRTALRKTEESDRQYIAMMRDARFNHGPVDRQLQSQNPAHTSVLVMASNSVLSDATAPPQQQAQESAATPAATTPQSQPSALTTDVGKVQEELLSSPDKLKSLIDTVAKERNDYYRKRNAQDLLRKVEEAHAKRPLPLGSPATLAINQELMRLHEMVKAIDQDGLELAQLLHEKKNVDSSLQLLPKLDQLGPQGEEAAAVLLATASLYKETHGKLKEVEAQNQRVLEQMNALKQEKERLEQEAAARNKEHERQIAALKESEAQFKEWAAKLEAGNAAKQQPAVAPAVSSPTAAATATPEEQKQREATIAAQASGCTILDTRQSYGIGAPSIFEAFSRYTDKRTPVSTTTAATLILPRAIGEPINTQMHGMNIRTHEYLVHSSPGARPGWY